MSLTNEQALAEIVSTIHNGLISCFGLCEIRAVAEIILFFIRINS
ncbi:hypothetical protein FHS76_002109 [Ochrobactrum daejeonense]|uniref:Uncharacterized protein n=1 Tax=Brucella daejeonensis TaxID=659015 RepID=A0A7W9AX51_9HYPH|nr:hypothetical protein [Brucella daejeonensis]